MTVLYADMCNCIVNINLIKFISGQVIYKQKQLSQWGPLHRGQMEVGSNLYIFVRFERNQLKSCPDNETLDNPFPKKQFTYF